MPVTFKGYLRLRAPERGVTPSGIIVHALATLHFGAIAGEFRRYLVTNKLRYSPAEAELVIRPHRSKYNRSLNNPAAQTEAKIELIEALDKYSEKLRVTNRLAVIPPGQLTAALDTLRPGYSVAGGTAGAGTIGGFMKVRRPATPAPEYYLLSNAHVLAENPRAAGQASVTNQPAQSDGGARRVGQLAYYTRLDDLAPNPLDAGIALLDPGIAIDLRYGDLGEMLGVRDPVRGETLRMYCRTSGYVEAMVAAIGVARNITVPANGLLAEMPFENVTELTRGPGGFVNVGGDSGGVWIGSDLKAVLLNFAGGEDSPSGWAFPMSRVITWVRSVTGDPAAGLMGIEGSVWGP